ncbi:MAG: hypothetical protein RIQ79_290 [Verrucomicrobiota bacterium]
MRLFPLLLALPFCLASVAPAQDAGEPAAAVAAPAKAAKTAATKAAATSTAPAVPATAPGAPKSAAESAFNVLGTGNIESNTLLSIINKAFDTDSDAFNPEEGTVNWKGHTYNVGQFRVFRARFERYLGQPESIDQDVYRAIVNEIFSLLSTRGGEVASENTRKAWQLLYRASEFESDGGASLSIANEVFNAWRIRDEKEAIGITQSELERIRRQQQSAVSYSGDLMAQGGVDAAADAKAKEDSKEKKSSNAGRDVGDKTTATPIAQFFRTRDLAETEAKIKASEGSAVLTGIAAKLQFQSTLVTLFLQRRFQHCLIAASFYRYIFKGSAQTIEPKLKKEISTFLPSSDLAVTVETLEFLSREAMNETETSMQGVRASYTDGQLVAALERLQECFFLGEFLPPVAQFEREKKQTLLNLYKQVDEARKLADLKDYEAVDKLVVQIGASAKDFRTSEVTSALRAAQRMSTLSLYGAQQAAASGDFTRAQEGIQRAAGLWPLNPALKTYTENMAQQVDLGSQAAVLFDDASKRDDLRRIYDQRSELAIALLSDAVRGPQLKEIIERISRVEIYLAQAKELVAQNNAFAAWEALDAACTLTPNDVIVNQRRADLAPRVAAFVGRVDSAKRQETAGNQAAALTQYLAAQGLYPASSLARTGIERVSALLLDELTAAAARPTAKAAKSNAE